MTITRRKFTGLALATATATVAMGATPLFAADSTGQLSGRKGYNVSGTVKVKKEGGKTLVVLEDDYIFDPAKNPPDIKIAFGKNEKYASGSHIHRKLKVKKGAATFEVPANINTDNYNELYIYCEQFTVILAVAPLS